MKRFLILMLALMLAMASCSYAFADVPIDEAHFPDPVFRAYIASADVKIDKNMDGYLSNEEIAEAREIGVRGNEENWYSPSRNDKEYISSLKGVELFANLQSLDCAMNLIKSIDLSNNKHLRYLYCNNNLLDSLNVEDNAFLCALECQANNLTSLDVSSNYNLVRLYCGDAVPLMLEENPVKTAKVNADIIIHVYDEYTELSYIYGGVSSITYFFPPDYWNKRYSNRITELDVSKNASLRELSCSGLGLKSLDVSNNEQLLVLHCNNNELQELDLSNNPNLLILSCYSNDLKNLNLQSADKPERR